MNRTIKHHKPRCFTGTKPRCFASGSHVTTAEPTPLTADQVHARWMECLKEMQKHYEDNRLVAGVLEALVFNVEFYDEIRAADRLREAQARNPHRRTIAVLEDDADSEGED